MTPGLGLVLIAAAALLGFLVWKGGMPAGAGALDAGLAPRPVPSDQPISIQIASAAGGSGDDRYTRAPKPERQWMTQPELPTRAEMYGKLPQVPTRGIPESYQSMGIVKLEDGAILPLYGRRTASRSDRFQYYTRTDSYNPVQLPIQHRRRDCQDDVGCEELSDGDSIQVAATDQRGTVTIYRFSGPTYVPGIL